MKFDRAKILKRVLIVITWVAVIGYMVVTLGFVDANEKKVRCSKVEIVILDSTKNFFVEEEDVIALFNDKKIRLLNEPIEYINTSKIEDLLNRQSSIRKADVYRIMARKGSGGRITEGILRIEIYQRRPIMRIINISGESYYIDDKARVMPLSDKYTAHVPVISGSINESYAKYVNIDLSKPVSGDRLADSLMWNIYQLGKFIWNHDLWRSQIAQVYVRSDFEIELVPRIGTQTIIFGAADRIEDKFTKLGAIYSHGFNNLGWNTYKEINLKFNNQVICTKIE